MRAALVSLVLLAACAPAPAEPPAEPSVGPIPVVRTGADIVLPLDRHRYTDEQRRLLAKAVDIVGDRCMRRFGLEWRPKPDSVDDLSNARRYTNLDPALASASGYHAFAEEARPAPPPLPKAVTTVWLGEDSPTYNGIPVPKGGCVGETMREVRPGIEQIEAGLPQKLQWQSFGLMRKDNRVAAVFASWSSCMAAKGFHYRDPSAAANDPRWRGERVSPQEIATAVADVACKLDTNVAGVMLAVETAYQRRLMDEHATALAAVAAYSQKELAIAHQVADG